MKEILDYLFKLSILIILLLFLFVFYSFSENGRYIYRIENISDRMTDRCVIDSRSGKTYGIIWGVGKPFHYERDFVNGILIFKDITEIDKTTPSK